MDYFAGDAYAVTANYKPKWTCWKRETVKQWVKDQKRYHRRVYKQYLKTGDIRDFNRSQRKVTNWTFD